MKALKSILLISLFSMLLYGCSSTVEPDNSKVGLTYFPLETGLYKIYDAERIAFNILGFDTTTFQLKEIVADSFVNATGGHTYILKRYTRVTAQEDWEIDSVLSAKRTANQLLVVENNLPYAKLSFPIANELEWDGNAHNAKAKDTYLMQHISENQTINSNQLITLTVTQADESTIVKKDERYEVYAEHIGLVKKVAIMVDYVSDSQDEQYAKEVIVGGYSYKLSLIEHGKE